MYYQAAYSCTKYIAFEYTNTIHLIKMERSKRKKNKHKKRIIQIKEQDGKIMFVKYTFRCVSPRQINLKAIEERWAHV